MGYSAAGAGFLPSTVWLLQITRRSADTGQHTRLCRWRGAAHSGSSCCSGCWLHFLRHPRRFLRTISHRIHGITDLPTWMADFYGKFVGKCTSPMDPMGIQCCFWTLSILKNTTKHQNTLHSFYFCHFCLPWKLVCLFFWWQIVYASWLRWRFSLPWLHRSELASAGPARDPTRGLYPF